MVVVDEDEEDATLVSDCCFCRKASDFAMTTSLSCGGLSVVAELFLGLLSTSFSVAVTDMGRLSWIMASSICCCFCLSTSRMLVRSY